MALHISHRISYRKNYQSLTELILALRSESKWIILRKSEKFFADKYNKSKEKEEVEPTQITLKFRRKTKKSSIVIKLASLIRFLQTLKNT